MNEENQGNDRLIYEIGYHLLPNIEESDVPVQSLKIKSIIEENGGTVISEEMPRMTALSYDISKNIDSKRQSFNKAYFGWVKFEGGPLQVVEIKNKVDSMTSVLRFIVIKTVRENTLHVPKIPMFKKENNDREEKENNFAEKTKSSEAEIDKSIDELVIEETL